MHDYTKYYKPTKNDVVLDCGACVGESATTLFRHCKQVICVEPDMFNLFLLYKHVRKLKNMLVVNAALSDHRGIIRFFRSEPEFSCDDNAGCVMLDKLKHRDLRYSFVVGDTVDNIMGYLYVPVVDVVKMDIQGSEVSALDGAVNTLKDVRYIAVESHVVHGMSTSGFIVDFLERHGFVVTVENNEGDVVYGVKK